MEIWALFLEIHNFRRLGVVWKLEHPTIEMYVCDYFGVSIDYVNS
jgi:hypothetical protein